jgi:hypothetical protein
MQGSNSARRALPLKAGQITDFRTARKAEKQVTSTRVIESVREDGVLFFARAWPA